jgi:hypothetical protein
MVVFERLVKKLPDKYDGPNGKYSDEPGKKKHILKNMLYMVELDPTNVKIARRIFGKDANISCANFLEQETKWRKDLKLKDDTKFDVIIGNPPFNDSQEYTDKKGGGDSLWPKFVIRSLELLVNNGFLVYVHPSGWRKPESSNSKTQGLFKIMAHDNHIKYLEIHDSNDGLKTFGAGTRYDWYVLQKHKTNNKTEILDQNRKTHNINLLEWNFLPNYDLRIIKPLLSAKEEDFVIFSRNQYGTDKSWTNENKTNNYKYPLIHSTPQSGVRYYYTSTKTPNVKNFIPMFGIPKVIFGETGIYNAVLDSTGK